MTIRPLLPLPEPRSPSESAIAAARAVDPTALAVVLSLAAVTDPLLVAARTGIEVAGLRRERRRAMIEASHDVSAAQDWARAAATSIPHTELLRRRFPPHGDRAAWVRSGGAA